MKTTDSPKTSSKPNGSSGSRGRLLHTHVGRDKTIAAESLKKLANDLDAMSERGYSPVQITGVGEHLFILLEHEAVQSRRIFRPMATFFNILHQYEDGKEPSEMEEPKLDTPPVPHPDSGATDTI